MPLNKGRLLLLQTVKEEVWREHVLDWARQRGWRCYFTWTSVHSPPGFPDLVLIRPPRLIFAELKTETGQLRTAQDEWIADLNLIDQVETYVWRPHDEERVLEVLAATSEGRDARPTN